MFKYLWYTVLVLSFAVHCYGENRRSDYQIAEKDSKKGLLDEEGTVLIPYEYDDLGWSDGKDAVSGNIIGYKLDGKWGLVNLENERITRAVYSGITLWKEDRFIASRSGIYSTKDFYGVLNSKGKPVVGLKYYSIEPHGNVLLVGLETEQRFLFGLVDHNNEQLVATEYLQIEPISATHFAVTHPSGRIGIFETTTRKLSQFELDSIMDFHGNYALIYNQGKAGVINRNGDVVVPVEYKEIVIKPNPGINVLDYDQWTFLDQNNKELNRIYCDSIFPVRDNLYQIIVGNAEAIVNEEVTKYHFGRWKIWYYEPGVILVKSGHKFGVIDEFGNEILESEYDSIRYSQGYLYTLKKSGPEKGWSIRNSLGQEISPFKYQDIGNMVERRLRVRRKDHWGYLNAVGVEVIDCKFSDAQDFDHALAVVGYLDGLGVIDRKGEWMVHPYQEILENGPPGLFITRGYFQSYVFNHLGDTVYQTYSQLIGRKWGILEQDQGKYGLINRHGKSILKTVYDRIEPVSGDSIFAIWSGEEGAVVDLKGNQLLRFNRPYEDILFIDNGLLGIRLDEKFGMIDWDGNLRIANRYEGIKPSEDGMVPVMLLGKWGFVDADEVLLVQPRYDSVGHFEDGLAMVIRDEMRGIIDRQGEELFKPEYSQIYFLANGNFLLQKDGKWGLANSLGHIVAHHDFDTAQELDNGHLIISRKNKWGLIAADGQVLIPQMYDYLQYDPYMDIYLARTRAEWKIKEIGPAY